MKKSIILIPIICLISTLFTEIAFAAPVYIDSFGDFPAYPYNTAAYMDGGAYVGCGPTTGAMIFGYFEHVFSLTGLLDAPVAGVDEGLETAWALHGASYMDTNDAGFGSPYDIKPGLEDYASDRGHEVKVMGHAKPGEDPATSWYNSYGAYGDAWTDDGYFWRESGGVWDIDPDDFCDFVTSKLSSNICIMLTVDSTGDGGGDHWIPCVGIDKDTDEYYYYDTYSTTIQSADIDYVGVGIDYGISFVRSIEYIPITEEHDVAAVDQTVVENEVLPGTVVDIDVTVTNLGSFTETFDLSCYYDSVLIGTVLVVDLAPGEIRVVTFSWDTTGVVMNTYLIKAHADSGETITEVDEQNNWCTMELPIFVVPELPFGTLIGVISMLAALVILKKRPSIKI